MPIHERYVGQSLIYDKRRGTELWARFIVECRAGQCSVHILDVTGAPHQIIASTTSDEAGFLMRIMDAIRNASRPPSETDRLSGPITLPCRSPYRAPDGELAS